MADDRIVLEGDEAIALWKQGKDAWNAWVDENPEADVSFAGVDFSKHVAQGEGVSFDLWRFPVIGTVSFSRVAFEDGGVSFVDTEFGEGDVYFTGARFGDGGVSFRDAHFGGGTVSFHGADFGSRYVIFTGTSFWECDVDFIHANFGVGNVFLSDPFFEVRPISHMQNLAQAKSLSSRTRSKMAMSLSRMCLFGMETSCSIAQGSRIALWASLAPRSVLATFLFRTPVSSRGMSRFLEYRSARAPSTLHMFLLG
ncbi:MAG: pentapeptide repeat-containing protein [Thalassobaculaceae bacterium]